jgi:hypothetical protein
VRILVSPALYENDFLNVIKLMREIFEGLGENAAVEGIERGEICERYRRYQNYGTKYDFVFHHSTINSQSRLFTLFTP